MAGNQGCQELGWQNISMDPEYAMMSRMIPGFLPLESKPPLVGTTITWVDESLDQKGGGGDGDGLWR